MKIKVFFRDLTIYHGLQRHTRVRMSYYFCRMCLTEKLMPKIALFKLLRCKLLETILYIKKLGNSSTDGDQKYKIQL